MCILIKCNEKICSLPSSLQRLCSHESYLSQAFPRLTGEHGLQLKTEYWRRKGSASRGDSDQHFFSPSPRHLSLCARFSDNSLKYPLTLKTLRSKFEFSFVAPIHFLQKWWGEVDKISSKFIICDHVCNSHDHSVLQNIAIT